MMIPKIQFEIVASDAPILGLQTRLGGQPHWKTTPSWPLSLETDEKMLFLGQILLEEQIFPGSAGQMAYIFVDDVEIVYHEAIVVILQPGTPDPDYAHTSAATGPTLYEIDKNRAILHRQYGYRIIPTYKQEPIIDFSERYTQADVLDYGKGYQFNHPELAGNKIGGQALYVETGAPPAYFTSEDWRLLLQLAPQAGYWNDLRPNFYPFHMELGEFGLLSVFIKKDYTQAKAYVQQP